MTDKYYTPEIEELVFGLEYEELVGYTEGGHSINVGKESWVKRTCDLSMTMPDIGFITDKKEDMLYYIASDIRVKHLDREDIESCGWGFKKEKNKAMLFEILKDDFNGRRRSKLIMAFNPISQWICIALVIEKPFEENEERTFFAGTIKNKSELARVLKQVGVV